MDYYKILKGDSSGKWKQLENKKCFCNFINGRALYIYDKTVKFWEDIRAPSHFIENPLPQTEEELLELIGY